MKKQRNMFQMKEQDIFRKISCEVEISDVHDKEFKVMVIKMYTMLCRRMDEWSEIFKVPNRAEEYNSGVNSRMNVFSLKLRWQKNACEYLSSGSKNWKSVVLFGVLEDIYDRFYLDEAKESMNKSGSCLRDWWDNSKWNNICIIGVPEEEDREKVRENLFEKIMTENYPELREQKSRSRKPRELQIRWTKKTH